MNSNTVYEGVATGTVVNGIAEIVVTQIAEHACRCDECKALDLVDLPVLALCKRYLDREISKDEFYLEIIKCDFEEPPEMRTIHRNFDEGALDLASAIEGFFIVQTLEIDEHGMHTGRRVFGGTQEEQLRLLLRGLVFGYENRMRTVHRWRRTKSGESSI
jgi:hypothetical protein